MATSPTRSLHSLLILSVAVLARIAAAQSSAPQPAPPSQIALAAKGETTKTAMLPVSPPALFDFHDADIRFDLRRMMEILRDRNHEGWALAAYPDPNTGKPLIGAGFSLDVSAIDHPQPDPLNPHAFLEPSSAQLWQAAGLDPELLKHILEEFYRNAQRWPPKEYRKKLKARALAPQLTEEQAMRLLRVSAIQAASNARAYCRYFDRLTGSQQMALAQLVFQMGTNLQEFVDFLSAINEDEGRLALPPTGRGVDAPAEDWTGAQSALIDSRWAKLYSARAVKVIAMFDPGYSTNPGAAERRIEAVLRPPRKHRRGRPVKLRSANRRTPAAHGPAKAQSL